MYAVYSLINSLINSLCERKRYLFFDLPYPELHNTQFQVDLLFISLPLHYTTYSWVAPLAQCGAQVVLHLLGWACHQ